MITDALDYIRVVIAAIMVGLAMRIAPKDSIAGRLIRDALCRACQHYLDNLNKIKQAEKFGLDWEFVDDNGRGNVLESSRLLGDCLLRRRRGV